MIRSIISDLMSRDDAEQLSGYTINDLDEILGINPFVQCLLILDELFDEEKYMDISRAVLSHNFDVEHEVKYAEEIKAMVSQHPVFKDYPTIAVLLFDMKYTAVPFEFAKKILELCYERLHYSDVDKMQAAYIIAWMCSLTGYNFIGVCSGIRQDKTNNMAEGGHTWNMVLTTDGLYVFDPMTGRLSKNGEWDDCKFYCGGILVWG